MLKASLAAPSETLAIKSRLLSSARTPWAVTIVLNLSVKSFILILLKSNLWHLDKIVIGSLCGSVVANIKITFWGGSSNVFKNAFTATIESIWTSSIM